MLQGWLVKGRGNRCRYESLRHALLVHELGGELVKGERNKCPFESLRHAVLMVGRCMN